MGLVKEYLVSIEGVHIYAIIAMILFMAAFFLMIYHAYSLRKDDVRQYSELPLNEDESDHIEY